MKNLKNKMAKKRNKKLYIITPDRNNLSGYFDSLDKVIDSSKIDPSTNIYALQLRVKNHVGCSDNISDAHDFCLKHRIPLVVNDYPDLAWKNKEVGLHIGEGFTAENLPPIPREEERVLGFSCYGDVQRAVNASLTGQISYVAFGAFFPTTTKIPKAFIDKKVIDDFYLKMEGHQDKIPDIVGIGGINHDNIHLLPENLDIYAIVSAICDGDILVDKSKFSRLIDLL